MNNLRGKHSKSERPDLVGGSTILLVDDDPSVLHVAALYLEDLGYQVIPVSRPEEAAQMLENRSSIRIAALMTDVAMPGMSGVELAARARAVAPGLPVVFFSAYAEGVISSGRNTRFLHKPFAHDELATTLEDLCGPLEAHHRPA